MRQCQGTPSCAEPFQGRLIIQLAQAFLINDTKAGEYNLLAAGQCDLHPAFHQQVIGHTGIHKLTGSRLFFGV